MARYLGLLVACFGLAVNPGDEAGRFLDNCRKGTFNEAAAQFDPKLPKAISAAQLKGIWDGLTAQVGPLKGSFGAPRVEPRGDLSLVKMRCPFEKSALDALITVNPDGKLVGLYFVPPEDPEADKRLAAYDDPSKYEEREVTVGAEGWPLQGTLTTPKGAKLSPLVVLVQGSGPNDRNETIGPNAPFRDLAHGLAARGVATLRYEKRTRAYGEKFGPKGDTPVTIDAEVIEDALAALTKGRAMKGIDSKRVFVLGHSLGGTAAPEIARRDGKLAGVIVFAGADRQPDAIVLEELAYIAENDPQQTEGVRKMLKELEPAFKRIRSGEAKDSERVMGATVGYWKTWMALTPAKTAAGLKDLPMLVLQGGRDYQVTEADYQAFRKALDGRKNVVFRLYPDLNHLFVSGKGKIVPAEYFKKGFVDGGVIDDIARWIKTGK